VVLEANIDELHCTVYEPVAVVTEFLKIVMFTAQMVQEVINGIGWPENVIIGLINVRRFV